MAASRLSNFLLGRPFKRDPQSPLCSQLYPGLTTGQILERLIQKGNNGIVSPHTAETYIRFDKLANPGYFSFVEHKKFASRVNMITYSIALAFCYLLVVDYFVSKHRAKYDYCFPAEDLNNKFIAVYFGFFATPLIVFLLMMLNKINDHFTVKNTTRLHAMYKTGYDDMPAALQDLSLCTWESYYTNHADNSIKRNIDLMEPLVQGKINRYLEETSIPVLLALRADSRSLFYYKDILVSDVFYKILLPFVSRLDLGINSFSACVGVRDDYHSGPRC